MEKFIIKPVFVGWSTLLAHLPFQLFFTFWAGGFFGGMFQVAFGKNVSLPVSPFILVGGFTFVALPLTVFVTKKFNYLRTEYKFLDDRLEFEEGFFTINKKVVKFKDVKETNLRKGPLQRVNGLGTIYLATTATGAAPFTNPFSVFGFGNTSNSGIAIRDIPNSEQEFERIRQLIDLATKATS